jgi:bile acid:Na+ symporter, BASS family
MPDVLGSAFELLIAVTVVITATAIGLETYAAAIRAAVRRRLVLASLVGVNTIALPLAAAAIVAVLPMADGPATGVLLCALCAAGPLALKAAQLARGDLAWALSLTVVLTVVNAGALPLWSSVLLPESVAAKPGDLLGAMVLLVVLPVGLGVVVRWIRPRTVSLVPRLEVLSNVTLVLAITAALIAYSDELLSTAASWAPVAILSLLVIAAVGAQLVPSVPAELRRVSTLVTMNRATGIALLVVSRAFADQVGVVSTVIAYGLLQTAVVLTVAVGWRIGQAPGSCRVSTKVRRDRR